ncbi:uncharacterized protein MELLADRAFT_105064 [Melampsora larici-populina 98AG31]|uniref:Uncharacterized protein n=1 Tax=Melampsora larici-populina (strain 98AG31 / pathotype 3-4-7) TaxID=747676 RepID=F4RH48_MELLP|nr:uncharacterized protein MELLADRAFT_105064 [Melampsora larici-populina 98AG31]EGG08135.1 hypothetical protein MELLADRAFT_105064 [Melampsora larici-populina 98AG31]
MSGARKTKMNLSLLTWRPRDLLADIQIDLVASFGEFIGTVTLMMVGLGGIQAAGTSNIASLRPAASQTTASTGTTGSSSINTVASAELFPTEIGTLKAALQTKIG